MRINMAIVINAMISVLSVGVQLISNAWPVSQMLTFILDIAIRFALHILI